MRCGFPKFGKTGKIWKTANFFQKTLDKRNQKCYTIYVPKRNEVSTMFSLDAQILFNKAIAKAKEREENTMNKNTIVYEHTDGRLFRLRVIPNPESKGHAEVTIYEMRGGYFYHPVDTRSFDVAKFDTIVAGAMCCLYGYLAENTEKDDIARKWKEFENRA